MDEPGLPTLYEWAGGLEPLRRMIDRFYDRVEADESLAGFFPVGVSEHHRAHVADWWSEVLGGPETYSEQHGGTSRCCATTWASPSRPSSGTASPRR